MWTFIQSLLSGLPLTLAISIPNSLYLWVLFCFVLFCFPGCAKVPRSGIEPAPHQQPEPQQWPCQILNLLGHQRTAQISLSSKFKLSSVCCRLSFFLFSALCLISNLHSASTLWALYGVCGGQTDHWWRSLFSDSSLLCQSSLLWLCCCHCC